MSCNCLFSDHICKCIPYDDFIHINTSLTPAGSYTWIITDKFGHEYSGTVTAELDGTLQIPIAQLPDGMMSQYAGRFLIQLQDADACGALNFPMTKMYDGIELEVRGGTHEKNTIGCEVQCSGAGTQNILIPFTDVSTVTLDWSAYADAIGNNPSIQVYHLIAPGVYQLVSVAIQQIRSNGTLTTVEVDNGGPATGYVLLS
jgi:hypothetical protein